MKKEGLSAAYDALLEFDKKQSEKECEILAKVERKVYKEVFQDIEQLIEECEYTYDYKIVSSPEGDYGFEDEYEHLEGYYVNQTCNGGYTGDEFAGTISIKLNENEYFMFNYSM